jgi:hypothetical protein
MMSFQTALMAKDLVRQARTARKTHWIDKEHTAWLVCDESAEVVARLGMAALCADVQAYEVKFFGTAQREPDVTYYFEDREKAKQFAKERF